MILIHLFQIGKGVTNLTDTALLKRYIEQSGLTLVWIANEMGLTRECLYHKLRGESEFKASEIVKLSTILHLDRKTRGQIFLQDG